MFVSFVVLAICVAYLLVHVAQRLETREQKSVVQSERDMRAISRAVESYAMSNHAFPFLGRCKLSDIRSALLPYATSGDVPIVDPWGGEYMYSSDRCTYFMILSNSTSRPIFQTELLGVLIPSDGKSLKWLPCDIKL